MREARLPALQEALQAAGTVLRGGSVVQVRFRCPCMPACKRLAGCLQEGSWPCSMLLTCLSCVHTCMCRHCHNAEKNDSE